MAGILVEPGEASMNAENPARSTKQEHPSIVVLSSLFPSDARPLAGIFIRERMFRVGAHLPLAVVAPQAWFPGQGVLRRFRPHFRPVAPLHEWQNGIEVFRPRYLSVPAVLKRWDGFLMAVGARAIVRRLKAEGRCDIIDSHFGYPDGYAAALLGRWLTLPMTITMRGTEVRHAAMPALRRRLKRGLEWATRIFAVAESLKCVATSLGIIPQRVLVVGNGVDTERFHAVDRATARKALDLPGDSIVLVSVGGLCERKGFHRVIDCLPYLVGRYPNLQFVVAGGPSPEGDWTDRLQRLVKDRGVGAHVRFLGPVQPQELKVVLSAADVFVLATRNEGWANVLLEAMACGLPVIATDVGGNREVVRDRFLGTIVPFGDQQALSTALESAIAQKWDRDRIIEYARANSWGSRVAQLMSEFEFIYATSELPMQSKCA